MEFQFLPKTKISILQVKTKYIMCIFILNYCFGLLWIHFEGQSKFEEQKQDFEFSHN